MLNEVPPGFPEFQVENFKTILRLSHANRIGLIRCLDRNGAEVFAICEIIVPPTATDVIIVRPLATMVSSAGEVTPVAPIGYNIDPKSTN